MNTILAVIGGFIALVALLVFIRFKTGSKFEIKNSDVAFPLVIIALWLFVTGRIKELTVGDVKIVAAFENASRSPVETQVTKVPVEALSFDMKTGVSSIPNLVRRKSQALGFRLRHGGYYGSAIREYLSALAATPSFKYAVLLNPDGTLFGIADGRQIAALGAGGAGGGDYLQRFAGAVNDVDTKFLESLPGFISSKDALRPDSDTRTALLEMQRLDVQTLPVVDAGGALTGIVDRSKLSASMLIDITAHLTAANTK